MEGEILHSYEKSLPFFYRKYRLSFKKNVKCMDPIMSLTLELTSFVRGKRIFALRINNILRGVFISLIESVDSFASLILESTYFMRGWMIFAIKMNNFLKGVSLSLVKGVNPIISPTMAPTSFVRGRKFLPQEWIIFFFFFVREGSC